MICLQPPTPQMSSASWSYTASMATESWGRDSKWWGQRSQWSSDFALFRLWSEALGSDLLQILDEFSRWWAWKSVSEQHCQGNATWIWVGFPLKEWISEFSFNNYEVPWPQKVEHGCVLTIQKPLPYCTSHGWQLEMRGFAHVPPCVLQTVLGTPTELRGPNVVLDMLGKISFQPKARVIFSTKNSSPSSGWCLYSVYTTSC